MSKAWFTYNAVMPATCLRDGRRCLPAYVNICCRRNADRSPTLKHCRRQIVEVELNLTLPIGRRRHCDEMHVYGSSATYIFYVNSCRRDGADKINVISQKFAMNLELVYDASATPSGCESEIHVKTNTKVSKSRKKIASKNNAIQFISNTGL